MNIEEAVAAATAEASTLLTCLSQPVVAYHVTAIMREADVEHAQEMQEEFLRRSVEALIADGLENAAAERLILAANDVIYVPMTGVGRADLWVKQNIKDLIPWELVRPPTPAQMLLR